MTASLVGGSSVPIATIEGDSGYVSYTTSVGTPFPSSATVTLQSYGGDPAGGPAPQVRGGASRGRFDAERSAIISWVATFNQAVTLVENSVGLSVPNADPSITYAVETFDESSGQLVGYLHYIPLPCPTGVGCSFSSLDFVSDTPPYTVIPGVRYLSMLVANPAVTLSPAPAALASCPAATPTPQVSPSPVSATSSAPQLSIVCDSVAIPPVGSFSGTASYGSGDTGTTPSNFTVTTQSFLGQPPGAPSPLFRGLGKRRFDAQPQTIAAFRSTFSASASLVDSVTLNLPAASSSNTYTAETFDEASGQLLWFVQGYVNMFAGGGYAFPISLPSYAVIGGDPIVTLIVENSGVAPG